MSIDRVNLVLRKVCTRLGLAANSYCYCNADKCQTGQICWTDSNKNYIERSTELSPNRFTRTIEHELIRVLSDNENELDQEHGLFEDNAFIESCVEDILKHVSEAIDKHVKTWTGVSVADITCLSGITYERNIAKGRIAFVKDIEDDVLGQLIDVRFKMKHPIKFSPESFKAVRKYLEGCGERSLLFSYGASGFELLGYAGKEKLENVPEWFHIEIIGIHHWSFGLNAEKQLYVDYLTVKQAINPVEIATRRISTEFECDRSCCDALLNALAQQKHGTSVVFYQGRRIYNRLKRLYDNNRASMVEMPLDTIASFKADLRALSKIDGAFMVDMQTNKITYFGVILDGETRTPGRIDRGARFNMLNNFVSEFRDEHNHSLAVVISEDGAINMLPPDTG